MIAVRRAGDCHLRHDVGVLARQNFFGRRYVALVFRSDCFLYQAKHSIGAAQGLKAFESEARAFVFVLQGSNTEFVREKG